MIASLSSVWMQQQSRCDYKKNHAQCFCFATTFVCVIANTDDNFVIAKKRPEPLCDCNYFACVIATWSYLCGQSYLVIWLFMIASLNDVCLQLFYVRDYKQKLSVVAPWLSLCGWSYLVIWLFMIASLSSVLLQQQGHCDFKNYFVCHCKHYLLFYDCKKRPEQCVFATILRAWLQPEVICGCKTWLCLCG
jgi:hypothetical protein